jgi:ribose 5-phosphate isomerase B
MNRSPGDPSDQSFDREEISAMVREAVRQRISGQNSNDAGASAGSEAPAPQVIDESAKDVITEADLRGVHADVPAGALFLIREGAIITPAARDLIRDRGFEIRYRARRSAAGNRRLIAIGADHGGFEMKERLKEFLAELGYSHRDFGTFSEEAVDYPDFAHAVARAVANSACDLGIMIDGAGIGSCMTANKVPGVRAAMCYDAATASNSREHNYANVLTLGARMISMEKMREIVVVWLSTPEGASRHGKRVAKLIAVEKQYLR